MRIAFVGKGGSGKTTATALFSEYLNKKGLGKVLSIDADTNIHLPEMVLGKKFPEEKFLSNPESTKKIKEYLLGKNKLSDLRAFRKTTPPNSKSNTIKIDRKPNKIVDGFSIQEGGINIMAVGTYDSDGIGTSCYHNNLSILENLLTHSVESDGAIVVDMVAGTDAFASSLHAQFDMIILVVEPTKRSIEVFKQFLELSNSAEMEKDVLVMGNKIMDEEDKNYLKENIPGEHLIGFISESKYIKKHDKIGGKIEFGEIEDSNKKVFMDIFESLSKNIKDPNQRLEKIYKLHKKYVSQPFVKNRFGDLSNQIDPSFKFK